MNNFYRSLSLDEFGGKYFNENTPSQTNVLDIDEYFDKIQSLIHNNVTVRKSLIRPWHLNIFTIHGRSTNCQFEISRLTDEYWMLSIIYLKTSLANPSNWKYYLCDQWDGLIKCLNDFNIIK